MIYPAFPNPGDTLGITAPSAGVGHKIDSFNTSVQTLREQGYSVVETGSVRMEGVRSNYADIRGEEFNELLRDPDMKAILAASGGEFNIEVLPYIDWKALKRHPKWIAGASDPTNLLYVITTKYNIATMYGFNAGSFDWRPLHTFQRNALAILSGNVLRQDSFNMYDKIRDFTVDAPILDEPVHWDLFLPVGREVFPALTWRTNSRLPEPDKLNMAYDESISIDIQGRLIGGCIDCIAKLIGTPYDEAPDFVGRQRDVIWYFDVFEMSPEELYRTLLQMKYCGYFVNTRAVVFGRVMFPDDATDYNYIELLRRIFNVPILWNTDIGHVKPCMTLINGSLTRIRSSGGKGSIEMKLD